MAERLWLRSNRASGTEEAGHVEKTNPSLLARMVPWCRPTTAKDVCLVLNKSRVLSDSQSDFSGLENGSRGWVGVIVAGDFAGSNYRFAAMVCVRGSEA